MSVRCKSRHLASIALASLAYSVIGCTDDQAPPSEAISAELAHVIDGDSPLHLDELLAEIGDSVPEFGGVFYDADAQLVILATDAPDRELLDALLVRVLGLPPSDVAIAQVKPCTYTFAELHSWHGQLGRVVLPLPEVSMTDVDEATNRVTLGLIDANARTRVELVARSIGVPAEAMAFTVRPLIAPLAKVTEKVRPLRGGLQISRGPTICTMGFTMTRKGVQGFITNSHCTAMQGGNEHTKFGQPLLADLVGEEAFDLLYWVGEAPCEYPYVCRESDSAFVKATVGLERKLTVLNGGALDIQSYARVTGRSNWPVQGEKARKSGRTSGSTEGKIAQACAVVKSTTNQMYFCNHLVSGPDPMSQPGDSGSPVFRVTNQPANGDATLLGVLWGGSPGIFVFSPLGAIELDMGAIMVCSQGFNC